MSTISTRRATPKQRQYIHALLARLGERDNVGYVDNLSRQAASEFIDRLKGQPTRAERNPTCAACGQPLTDPESIERGMGPSCAARYA